MQFVLMSADEFCNWYPDGTALESYYEAFTWVRQASVVKLGRTPELDISGVIWVRADCDGERRLVSYQHLTIFREFNLSPVCQVIEYGVPEALARWHNARTDTGNAKWQREGF